MKPFVDDCALLDPLRWRRQRTVFVCSMTDLFRGSHPDPFIDRVFTVIAACPHHTFQLLTKRPERPSRHLSAAGRFPGAVPARSDGKERMAEPNPGLPDGFRPSLAPSTFRSATSGWAFRWWTAPA